jgi:proteasome accessory factor B
MASDDSMEPLERLLNLVGLLLETPRPLTFDQIRDLLDAYGSENVDSAKRKFERDKDLLRDWGVPLRMQDIDAWGTEQGYRIPKDEYYLPEIAFSPEEITALFVAAQSGGEEAALEQGLRKLLYGADGGVLVGLAGGPLVSGSDARSSLVLAAAEAASEHARVRFGYRTSQGAASDREVDAYGLVFKAGRWYLVGHDHERDDVRAFRLSRVTSDITTTGEGSAPPEGFRAAERVEGGPWVPSGDERAVVLFEPSVAPMALDALAGSRQESQEHDGRIRVSIPSADEGALAAMLLQYGPDAEVVEPASLRDEVIRRLERAAS